MGTLMSRYSVRQLQEYWQLAFDDPTARPSSKPAYQTVKSTLGRHCDEARFCRLVLKLLDDATGPFDAEHCLTNDFLRRIYRDTFESKLCNFWKFSEVWNARIELWRCGYPDPMMLRRMPEIEAAKQKVKNIGAKVGRPR